MDITPALGTLELLLRSPESARAYMERVDIAFAGYDENTRALDEIPMVRDYVRKLDEQFPFWLFFLSKHMLGLQCIIFCHLLPFLTAKGKAEHHPKQLQNLLLKRWFPAMNQVAEFAGLSEEEVDALTDRVLMYVKLGSLKLPYNHE